jgi:hypothetical protein
LSTVRRVISVCSLTAVILSPNHVIVYVMRNLTAATRHVKTRRVRGSPGDRQCVGSLTAWPSSPGWRLMPILRRIVGRMSTERSG